MYFNKNPRPHRKLDRRHYTYYGKTKVSYNTEEEAGEVLKHYPENYRAYICPVCNKWHIGFIKN